MKRRFLILSLLMLFGFITIMVIYLLSYKSTHHLNNFNREFSYQSISFIKAMDIQYNYYHIAGIINSKTYLGNEYNPFSVFEINEIFSNSQKLNILNSSNKKIVQGRVEIDSPFFYLIDRTTTTILSGKVGEWQASNHMRRRLAPEDLAIPIAPNSFVIRTFQKNPSEYVLAKESNYSSSIKKVSGILEKQIDGIFCTDGMLNYDSKQNLLVYVYYYRNQYLCIDTNLNLLYRGRTIDTTSRAQINVVYLDSDSTTTYTGVPHVINNKSCVNGRYLFINSNLKADNEGQNFFEKWPVIDVYDLKNGTYKSSFYLKENNRKKLRDFRVFNDTLIAISDHYLFFYKLDQLKF